MKYLIYKILRKVKYFFLSPLSYARSIGVVVGKYTKIMTKHFGTEPYLIQIGNYCEITANVSFVTHDGGVWVVRNMNDEHKDVDIIKPIIVHDNVYIGNNSIILPGVEIAKDTIIGAMSIVTKSIEKSGVYAGIPARYICSIEEYVEKNRGSFEYTKKLSYFEKKRFFQEKWDK